MQVDFIIVGQGISGTWLSYFLWKEKRSFIVIDNNDNNSPSRLAAGVINPVTGRRMVSVWMADEVLPFAWNAYQEIGNDLNIKAISQKNIIDFFPNPFMKENFRKRLEEGNGYIKPINEDDHFKQFFNYEFGCGEISPVYTAHLEILLPAWRNKLKNNGSLLETNFEIATLVVNDQAVKWSDRDGQTVSAGKIIFCDGAAGFDNPYFKKLPFAPNKGEALTVEIPGLPPNNIYKKSMVLAPLEAENLFWIGSNYLWNYENTEPTEAFRKETEKVLREWLKIPFRIVEHRSGLRPATLERRPFVGLHPNQSRIGILNGMGTKGCSLAPFFARQLVNHLIDNKPIIAEANVNRFQKILSLNIS